jgi:hypothetical protein
MRLVLSLIPALIAATAVVAKPAPVPPPPSDAALAAKLDVAAELADQNRRSEALNAEVHNKLKAVDARNAATKAAYDKAMADYNAAVAQHSAEVARRDAAAAKVQADYQKSMNAWKADVAACKAGDVARCGQPPAAAPATTAKAPVSRAASS